MKEIRDHELLHSYLTTYKLEEIFHEPLLPHMAIVSFDQGELICSQGEPSEYLYVLVKGKVKIFTTSPGGQALILSFKMPLDMIGDIEYVQGIDFINTVEAVSSVHMLCIHHRWLKKYNKDHAPFLTFLLEVITHKFYKSDTLSRKLMYSADVRLASYLLSVSFDESDALFEGQQEAISLKDVANLIGISYRHLNRVIQQFCSKGLIERKKGSIKVKDREGLRRLADQNIYE
ncbi:Crp/Fnr family transcriptional regulator [Bacillus horti]|uniref:CRP-like cAMP-binding protein n=1 Tax=Caldalkalibacillus horti TaxID=77523 RepID=A0ABT9VZB8_9BACI|nr:cyclic nucleotide-binding domain-containing protein [Bacillus horti]MDQ0166219.1 CRP-like cAMP-binding protein [Bacillus horti]